MVAKIIQGFADTITSPFRPFTNFIKNPLRFHLVANHQNYLKSATALYILAGVINLYCTKQLFWHLHFLSRGSLDLNISISFTDFPLVSELLISFYAIFVAVCFFPGAYYLSSRKDSKRSANEILYFIFCIGSVGAFVHSLLSAISLVYILQSKTTEDFHISHLISQLFVFSIFFIFFILFLINIKRFIEPLKWLHVIVFFVIASISLAPLNIILIGLSSLMT